MMLMMKGNAVLIGFGLVVVLAAGLTSACSGQKKEDWYDKSSEMTQREQDYINEQQSLGVDPEEAKANYWRDIFTIRTEGKNITTTLEGEELEQKINNP